MKVLLATNLRAMDDGVRALNVDDIEVVGEVYYLEAVKSAAEDADVVVLSSALPGDGDIGDVIYLLRCADKRIILLAGEKSNGIVNAAMTAGVYDILFDPVKPEDVVRLLREPRKFVDVAQMVINNAKKGNGGETCFNAALKERPYNMGSKRKIITVARIHLQRRE